MSLTSIVGKLFLPRQRMLERYNNEAEALQQSVLKHLIEREKDTEYGRNTLLVTFL